MSYILRCIKDKPVAAVQITDSLLDHSPYAVATTGSPTLGVSTAAGILNSGIFDSTHVGTIESDILEPGNESKTFSMEVSLTPSNIGAAGVQKILSSANSDDGFIINGTKLSFSTAYSSTGSATVTYDLEEYSNIHVVGVHTSNQNYLYINGVLVDSAPISTEQQADSYVAGDSKLHVGDTASGQTISSSAVCLYDYALTDTAIGEHYEASLTNRLDDSVRTAFGGHSVELFGLSKTIYVDELMDEDHIWHGIGSASTINGILEPLVIDGVQQYSYYTTITNLTDPKNGMLYGVVVQAEGEGFTLECSNNGDDWTAMTNNTLVPIFAEGTDPKYTYLFLRITLVDDQDAFVTSLSIKAYRQEPVWVIGLPNGDTTDGSDGGRTIDLTTMSINDVSGNELMSDYVGLSGSGSVSVSADTSAAANAVGTEEFWIKPLSGVITFDAGTTYVNGTASTNVKLGQWNLVHIVKSVASNDPVNISGDFRLSSIGIYPDLLSAQDIAEIYANYVAADAQTLSAASGIQASDVNEPVYIYANDWSITAAG